MDKVKRLLSSPSGRKRNLAHSGRYFAVPLEDLVKREGCNVPSLLQKICTHIQTSGLEHEGIFRINGNSKVVERIKSSFDKTGDADLVAANDVMAVASLLKLFLRELPEPVVPEYMTQQFIAAQEECIHDNIECARRLRKLVFRLPVPHQAVLKYLCRFLVVVSLKESANKMNPMALGIVFGPNIFSLKQLICTAGIGGLRQQGVTNQIVLQFITQYDAIFLQEGEISPYQGSKVNQTGREERKTHSAPPRPPPPLISGESVSPPLPSPRKSKQLKLDSSPSLENGYCHDSDASEDSRRTTPRSQADAATPRFTDDELSQRSCSPFVLDSDISEAGSSSLASYSVTNTNIESVERTISTTVAKHLFGESVEGSSSQEEDSLTPTPAENVPIPAPRKKHSGSSESLNADDSLQTGTMRDRISKFEKTNSTDDTNQVQQDKSKRRPKSQAFEMFEKSGIIIGMAPPPNMSKSLKNKEVDDPDSHHLRSGYNSKPPGEHVEIAVEEDSSSNASHEEVIVTKPKPKPRNALMQPVIGYSEEGVDSTSQDSVHSMQESDDSGFGSIQRQNPTLSSFKRPQGPRNRRTPTRGSLKKHTEVKEEDNLENTTELDATDGPQVVKTVTDQHRVVPRKINNGQVSNGHSTHSSSGIDEDMNHNKPSIKFLDLYHSSGNDMKTPSPDRAQKPFVPPLDLTILHEHGDGSEPIPVSHAPASYNESTVMHEDVLLSPRLNKLKKKRPNYRARLKSKLATTHNPDLYKILAYSSADQNTDVPPSPPTHQSIFDRRNQEEYALTMKQLTKKIQACKKKIKLFEESFESTNGYRPSQSDKATNIEIRKSIQELAKARKELKKIKEESVSVDRLSDLPSSKVDSPVVHIPTGSPLKGNSSGEPHGAISNDHKHYGGFDELPANPTIQDTLSMLEHKLADKRRDAGRPNDLRLMGKSQIQDEKLAVQKALLQYENLHGRPSTKESKELMKPLYDRYRSIKRSLHRPMSPRDKGGDLQVIKEGHVADFESSPVMSTPEKDDPMSPQEDDDYEDTIGRPSNGSHDDFAITQNFALLRETHKQNAPEPLFSPDGSPHSWKTNMHTMSTPQLLDEQYQARLSKKRLRRLLRNFEDDFFTQTGRKVQKEDRAPMEAEYHEYKQVKARLKLLDALLAKRDPSCAVP